MLRHQTTSTGCRIGADFCLVANLKIGFTTFLRLMGYHLLAISVTSKHIQIHLPLLIA